MKLFRKFIGIFIVGWLALLASSSTVFAGATIQKVIDQKYSQPDYVIGSSYWMNFKSSKPSVS